MGRRRWPKTVAEAVDQLLVELPPEEIERLRAMPEAGLGSEHFGLGMWIRNEYGLHEENYALLKAATGEEYLFSDADRASSAILDALWRKLRA
jgi:hypothetical protein